MDDFGFGAAISVLFWTLGILAVVAVVLSILLGLSIAGAL